MRFGKFRPVLGYGVAAVLIAGAGVWAARHWNEVSAVLALGRPGWLVPLVPLAVGSILTVGLMNQLMASHLGAPLRLGQWVSLGFASTLANYVLPMRAGLAMRAVYYRKQSGLPVARFASAMAVAYLLTALVNAAVVAGSLGWIRMAGGPAAWPLFWGAMGVVAVCVLVLVHLPKAPPATEDRGFRAALAKIRTGWDLLRRDPALLAKAGGLTLGATALSALRLYIAFLAIGHPVSASGAALIGGLVGLSLFISITPAALGIREGVIVLSCMVVGVEVQFSLLAAAADRAVMALVVLVCGPVAAAHLSRETARTAPQEGADKPPAVSPDGEAS